LLVTFLGGRRARDRCFVLLFHLLFIFNFPLDKMQNVCLSSEEERMAEYIFAGVFSALVEAVHVELPYEGVDISMSKELGEDLILKIIDFFDGEFPTVGHPMYDGFIIFIFQYLETLLNKVSD